VNKEPSLATARRTYVPGSWNVARTIHLLSGGGTGITYGGDHGEFEYTRVSIHVFIWSGLKVTVAALPRYTIHDSRKPGPLRAASVEVGLYAGFEGGS
jgi:hypothetical protein